jgi:hypothetical protein
MIVKNPTIAANKMSRFIPYWTADGTKVVDAVLNEAHATAKLPGALLMTASGYMFRSYGYHACTGSDFFAVNLETGAAGDVVPCAIEGFVSDVSLSGTGTVTTCYSTFSVGGVIMVQTTGHLTQIAASWLDRHWTCSTVNTTWAAIIGIALSSGDDKVVHDLWLVGKPHIHPAATA